MSARLAPLPALCSPAGPGCQKDPYRATSVCMCVEVGEDAGPWASLTQQLWLCQLASQLLTGPSEGRLSRSGRAVGGFTSPTRLPF